MIDPIMMAVGRSFVCLLIVTTRRKNASQEKGLPSFPHWEMIYQATKGGIQDLFIKHQKVEYKIYQAPKEGIKDLLSTKRFVTRFIKRQKGEYKIY